MVNVIETKVAELVAKRDQLKKQLAEYDALKRHLEIVESNLELLSDFLPTKTGQPSLFASTDASDFLADPDTPAVGEAMIEAMKTLQKFTKNDVIEFVRSQYPKLDFSGKSVQRPLDKLVKSGEVIVLRQNQGNKTQAVYGFRKA